MKRARVGFQSLLVIQLKENNMKKIKSKLKMMKRADGSYSPRGLWDNIRANKGSGKKPTAEMLKQEKKIKAEEKKQLWLELGNVKKAKILKAD